MKIFKPLVSILLDYFKIIYIYNSMVLCNCTTSSSGFKKRCKLTAQKGKKYCHLHKKCRKPFDVSKYHGHPIIKFKKGMPLYHITNRRISLSKSKVIREMQEGKLEAYKKLKLGELLINPYRPMFFGLTPEFPYYYGADDNEYVALEFRLKESITLINIGVKGYEPEPDTGLMYGQFEPLLLKEGKVDGWLGFDDPYDSWREILILDPINKIDIKKYTLLNKIDTEFPTKRPTKYIWNDKELSLIKRYEI